MKWINLPLNNQIRQFIKIVSTTLGTVINTANNLTKFNVGTLSEGVHNLSLEFNPDKSKICLESNENKPGIRKIVKFPDKLTFNLPPCSSNLGPVFYVDLPERIHGLKGLWLPVNKSNVFSQNKLNNTNYNNTLNITNPARVVKNKDAVFPEALLRRVNVNRRGIWINSPCTNRKVGTTTIRRPTQDNFNLWFKVGARHIPINVTIIRN